MTRAEAANRSLVALWFALIESVGPWIFALPLLAVASWRLGGRQLPLVFVRQFATFRLFFSFVLDGIPAFVLADRFRTSRIRFHGIAAASSGALVGFLAACMRIAVDLSGSILHGSGREISAWPILAVGFVWQASECLLLGAAAGWLLSRRPAEHEATP